MGKNAEGAKGVKLMDEEKQMLERLDRFYQKACQICPPDQYQYRQNELLIKLAEFILTPYWNSFLDNGKDK